VEVLAASSGAGLAATSGQNKNACRLVAATMVARGSVDLPYGATAVFAEVLEELTGRRPTTQAMRWYISKVRTDAASLAEPLDFPPAWTEVLVCGESAA
ncbi:MAG: hypothetical protein QM644_21735, partial [Mobilitalea sp.]